MVERDRHGRDGIGVLRVGLRGSGMGRTQTWRAVGSVWNWRSGGCDRGVVAADVPGFDWGMIRVNPT